MAKLSLEDRAQLIAAPGTHTLQCAREHLRAVAAEARADVEFQVGQALTHDHLKLYRYITENAPREAMASAASDLRTAIKALLWYCEEAEQRGREQALDEAKDALDHWTAICEHEDCHDSDRAVFEDTLSRLRRGPDAEKGGEDA
jgi:acyl-CoA reductase-like NAD-dependent aldehyde dehydrogenase